MEYKRIFKLVDTSCKELKHLIGYLGVFEVKDFPIVGDILKWGLDDDEPLFPKDGTHDEHRFGYVYGGEIVKIGNSGYRQYRYITDYAEYTFEATDFVIEE